MRTVQTSLHSYSYQFSQSFRRMQEIDRRFARKSMIRKRRQQEVRRHILLLALSIIIVCSCTFLMTGFFTKASESHSETYKYYKSIQVSSGDSLWTIANEYIDEHYESIPQYIEEVKVMNALTEDVVKAGNYIIIPYYSDEFK